MSPRFPLYCAALLALSAAPARALSLYEAGQLALQGDPRASAAASAVGASQAGVDAAVAGYRPNVSVTASSGLQRYYFSDTSSTPFPLPSLLQATNANLRASQPLYTGGETQARVEAARQQLSGARQSEDQTRQALLLSAADAYLSVAADKRILTAREADVAALQQAQGDAQRRFAAGEATKTDTAQADARLAMAQAELKRAQALLANDSAAFVRVVGATPDALEERLPAPSLPSSLAEAQNLLGDTPAVLAAESRRQAALAQIQAARSAAMPKVSLDGTATAQRDTELAFNNYTDWSVQLKASLPLYQGGAIDARIAQARAEADRAAAEVADARRAGAETIAQAWANLQAAEQEIGAYEAAVSANELAYGSVRKELDAGTRTTLDVLDAERDRVAAQVQLANARRDRAVAAFQLLYACGRLRLDDLR